jgi:hypothetical protein
LIVTLYFFFTKEGREAKNHVISILPWLLLFSFPLSIKSLNRQFSSGQNLIMAMLPAVGVHIVKTTIGSKLRLTLSGAV